MAADRIRAGGADIMIAGGAESMSLVPMSGQQVRAEPVDGGSPARDLHEHGAHGGAGAEASTASRAKSRMRSRFAATRTRCRRRRRAVQRRDRAARGGTTTMNGNGQPSTTIVFARDEGPRADTSLEALAKLKPVFHAHGTVTAGNSSQTSDGAAAAHRHVRQNKAQRTRAEAEGAVRQLRGRAACRRRSWASARLWRFPRRWRWPG